MCIKKRLAGRFFSVSEIVETDRNFSHVFAQQSHGGLQVIALCARHSHSIALNGRLYFEFAFLEQFLNFLAVFGGNAVSNFQNLFDFVAAHFLYITFVEEANIDPALGHLVEQNFVNLGELKIGITEQGNFFVFEFNGGRSAFEVKAGGDFFGGGIDRIFYFNQVGFANSVKRWHGIQ